MSDSILTVTNLSKCYGTAYALRNCSFSVRRGQICGLIGANGAGKTTLMRLICGQSSPTEGTVSLFGSKNKKELIENRRRIGCMIETPILYPDFSAEKNLMIYGMKKGLPVKDEIGSILKTVGLANVGNKHFSKYSLGMKERMGIALALLGEPEFLILDEPMNGLDPVGVAEIRDLILRLNRERNITVLLSSHILKELSLIATDYIFIDKGEFISQMSAEELNSKCRQSFLVKVSDTKKACTVLENVLQIKDYLVLNDNSVRIFKITDHPEMIVRELVENDIDVFSASEEGQDLEQFYIELVKGGINNA